MTMKLAREKNVGPRSKAPIPVKVTPEEREAIRQTARKVGLPASTMLRRLGLGHVPQSVVDLDMLLELTRLRGDLSRLGGLLKLWLTGEAGQEPAIPKVHTLLDQILETQAKANEALAALRQVARIPQDR